MAVQGERVRIRASAAVMHIEQMWRRLAHDVAIELSLMSRELGIASRVAADLPSAKAALGQALAWIAQR